MKILTLRLDNFQGIKAANFDFDGQSASIYGDNATGKTTVFNAITWLLFDRPSTNAKNYTPKTKGPDGDVHFLDHAATARFSMEDGRIVTLKKVFHENYKKKRGSATEEFDGHSVDFYIDGVPVKEKEYTATLMAFCGGAEKMKLLTMPNYFAEEMSWDARRNILLDICGDVSDEEVIESSEALRELPAFLLMPGTTNQHYTVEEYKKIASARRPTSTSNSPAYPDELTRPSALYRTRPTSSQPTWTRSSQPYSSSATPWPRKRPASLPATQQRQAQRGPQPRRPPSWPKPAPPTYPKRPQQTRAPTPPLESFSGKSTMRAAERTKPRPRQHVGSVTQIV